MFARLLAARKDEEGFTLIELLVVIIIIGILAAIAIPVFLNQRVSAKKAQLASDARNGAVAVETYYTDNNALPAAIADTDAMASTGNTFTYVPDQAAGTYTLCVEAPATGPAASSSVTYESDNGGVQPWVATGC